MHSAVRLNIYVFNHSTNQNTNQIQVPEPNMKHPDIPLVSSPNQGKVFVYHFLNLLAPSEFGTFSAVKCIQKKRGD